LSLHHYILDDDHNPVPVELLVWAHWFEMTGEERSVGHTLVGPYRISTMFFGHDLRCFGMGPPLLFETCVFDSSQQIENILDAGDFIDESEVTGRCSTWKQAEKMHAKVVKRLERETGATAAPFPRTMKDEDLHVGQDIKTEE
jgi:hypothetical protein